MILSIVIPCLNEYSNLNRLIPILLLHSNQQSEIIVSDAVDSSDLTESLCREHNIRYHKSSYTHRAIQMNEGAHLATGAYLFFLHADVLPPQKYLTEITNVLKDNDFGLFPYVFDQDKWYLNINARFTKYKSLFCGGGDQGHFMTARLFKILGGYSNRYSIFEDFEFYDRVKNKYSIKIANSMAIVSSRKYMNNSYLKVNLVNLYAFMMYRMNIEPTRIKAFCMRWLKH